MNTLVRYWKWILGALIFLVVVGGLYCKRDLFQEQTKIETELAVDTTNYSRDTVETDWVLARDSAKPTIVAAVRKERASAVRVIKTQQKLVQNLKKQAKPTILSVFGELDYLAPVNEPLLEGNSSLKAGLQWQVRKGTFVKGYVDLPLTGEGERAYGVGVRQEIKLF